MYRGPHDERAVVFITIFNVNLERYFAVDDQVNMEAAFDLLFFFKFLCAFKKDPMSAEIANNCRHKMVAFFDDKRNIFPTWIRKVVARFSSSAVQFVPSSYFFLNSFRL